VLKIDNLQAPGDKDHYDIGWQLHKALSKDYLKLPSIRAGKLPDT